MKDREFPKTTLTAPVINLAGCVMQTLGIANYSEEEPIIDLECAVYLIELLLVLEEKTAGNLNPLEKRYLEDTFHALMEKYTAVSKAAESNGYYEFGSYPNRKKPNMIALINIWAFAVRDALECLEDPQTRERSAGLRIAKNELDLLEILKEKTAGNLNPLQEAYMERTFRELKLGCERAEAREKRRKFISTI